MKLDLGCGTLQHKGYIGMDIKDFGQEIVRDATRGLPFADNTLDVVYTHHFLEHIAQGEDLQFVLEECYRTLKNGGKLVIYAPLAPSAWAFDPVHLSFWGEFAIEHLCTIGFKRLAYKETAKEFPSKGGYSIPGVEMYAELEAVK